MRLSFEAEGRVARLVLTEAERGNPINLEFCRKWQTLVSKLRSRADLKLIILEAKGRYFSVGGDIGEFELHTHRLSDHLDKMTELLHATLIEWTNLPCFTLAVCQGKVAGGAIGIVASCDEIILTENASFHSGYAGIGFTPDLGVSYFLPRIIGDKRARRFLMTNSKLLPEEAVELGLASGVYDTTAISRVLKERVGATEHQSSDMLKTLKQKHFRYHGLETHLELEARCLSEVAGTANARSGLKAFIEKRQVQFD